MRPNHLHMIVQAPGFRKLTTTFYPEGDKWLESDAVFAVKESLVVVRRPTAIARVTPADMSVLPFTFRNCRMWMMRPRRAGEDSLKAPRSSCCSAMLSWSRRRKARQPGALRP